VASILRDRRFSSSPVHQRGYRPPSYPPGDPRAGLPAADLLSTDPPDHTRLRRLVAGAFTPRAIAGLEPWIREVTVRLLAAADGYLGTRQARGHYMEDVRVISRTRPRLCLSMLSHAAVTASSSTSTADSLARAMAEVDRVLLIATSDFQHRMQQHQNVIDAAKAAGVKLLGFTSRSLNDMVRAENAMMRDYLQTEALIRESGVPALIFRNALYLDTPPVSLGGPAVFTAGIRVPAGQGAVADALRREMRGAEDG
jgi:uncharacterized protein YbjT (DUF2867 family)